MASFWNRLRGQTQPAAEAGQAAAGLGAYDLQRELGRGAMAVVHLAVERASGRSVAIKRLALQREFAQEDLAEVRQRLLREARAAGHLRHPDILQVLDAGVEGQDSWIAMEYVQGHDLSHFSHKTWQSSKGLIFVHGFLLTFRTRESQALRPSVTLLASSGPNHSARSMPVWR